MTPDPEVWEVKKRRYRAPANVRSCRVEVACRAEHCSWNGGAVRGRSRGAPMLRIRPTGCLAYQEKYALEMEPIPLSALLGANFDPAEFKLHCAVYNGEAYPIEVLGNDPEEWRRWNSWRNVNDDFNRRYVFSLAQDRHDPTLWLFGGIWEVVGRRPTPRALSYDVVLREDLMGPFVRRLYVRLALKGRNRRRSMEACLADMTVSSILEEQFVGDPFPGHDRINHSLADIQTVVSQARPDWRIALEHMKGVYVIHDQGTGEPYVGSAYGDTGIWQRWSYYAATLHGDNVGLKVHLAAKGEDYFRHNMRFALLEFWSMRTEDQHIIDRETYWKEVLLSRSLGHNKN